MIFRPVADIQRGGPGGIHHDPLTRGPRAILREGGLSESDRNERCAEREMSGVDHDVAG